MTAQVKWLRNPVPLQLTAFLDGRLLFAGVDAEGQIWVYHCGVSNPEPMAIPWTTLNGKGLYAFGAYREGCIFVEGEQISLKRANDSAISATFKPFTNKTQPVKMAPSVSNDFVYLHNESELVLINWKHCKQTRIAFKDSRLLSASLNHDGSLLAYTVTGNRVDILQTHCGAKGRISLSWHATIESHATLLMFLPNNILAVNLGDRCTPFIGSTGGGTMLNS